MIVRRMFHGKTIISIFTFLFLIITIAIPLQPINLIIVIITTIFIRHYIDSFALQLYRQSTFCCKIITSHWSFFITRYTKYITLCNCM